jgi:hypothetical protein
LKQIRGQYDERLQEYATALQTGCHGQAMYEGPPSAAQPRASAGT